MARSACLGPVRAALKSKGAEKAFSDDEIEALIERLAKKRARASGDAGMGEEEAWRAAAEELTKEELRGMLIDRRARLAAEAAKVARRDLIDRMAGPLDQRLSAVLVGDERTDRGRGYSVDAIGRALESTAWGQVEKDLRAAGLYDRVAAWWRGADDAFEHRVEQEMSRLNGGAEAETGDASAVKVAEIFNRAEETSRQRQNAKGAWIAKLEGYTTRQTHDAIKVAGGFWRELAEIRRTGRIGGAAQASLARGFEKWRNFILPRLHERTFADLGEVELPADLPFPAAADPRERLLQRVWWDIVTGKHSMLHGMDDFGDFRPPASKARSVSASRILTFKDVASSREYRKAYGTKSLYAQVMSDVSRGARNEALMHVFGPAPEAAFAAEAERLGAKAATSGKLRRQFEELDGRANAPENMRAALIGRVIRTDQSLSKLGGMVISAWSDLPVAAQTLARAGVDWLDGYSGLVKGLARHPQAKEIADLLDVGSRSAAGAIAARFAATDGPIGWASWAMRAFYKVNGFDFWNEGIRAGAAHMLSAHLGAEAKVGWEALKPGTRETLTRYAIDPTDWEFMRQNLHHAEDGRAYMVADALSGDLELRFRTMVHDIVDTAVSEARARERSVVTAGTKPGTIIGEAVRMFTQFWAFPLAFVGRQIGPAAAGYAGKAPALLMAHLIASMTLFGYLSMQAKQIVKGRTPRPLFDQDGKPMLGTFIASALQGGGLGIYGDFLFGEYNRFGGSPLGTLGGPAVGEFERALKLFAMIRSGDERGSRKDVAPAAFQFALGNTPFVNLWYTRAALDYAIFWRMQEAMSPGWAERYQRNVKNSTGSDFVLKPTEAVAR